MKILISTALFFTSLSLFAAAPQVNCFDLAVNNRNMEKESAILLCAGATSNAPVLCSDLAERRGLGIRERILLCRGAVDNSPVNCFDLSASRNLINYEAIQLCSSVAVH